MKLPSMLNARVTRAQIDHPVVAAAVIRKLTGSSGKKSGATAGPATAPSAPTAASVPPVLTRTNGIDAAKVAAGVPTGH
ncbi:hypothetical protein [Corynebacterium kalidii]|uniref:Uncharacterized protein n=1 Tax=Corynebacterium kalidii TaxID=2931982 RepID=A0A9X1WEG4_9CORY|nr:hypothetical protein [Corynebacterium kalidii]MCJ7857524.1 hypothetical protein [Corynebacterium kalidii]